MKSILQIILYHIARLILKRHQPEIIGITGSVGKTSTKQAIMTVLASKYSVRTNPHNYNNELGVPLTIIGAQNTGGKNLLRWLVILLKGLGYAILPLSYPKILVLEMGADHPGDIKYLTRLAPAHIGIVTMISDQPVHLEHFKDVDQLAQEKNTMYKHLGKADWAIINLDEPYSVAVAPKLKAKMLSIAITNPVAELRAVEIDYSAQPGDTVQAGLRFKLQYQGNTVPCFMPGVLGTAPVYAAMFAAAVGIIYDLNLVDISTALRKYQAPLGRMHLIAGKNKTLIIDDTYNSSPAAVREALTVLHNLPTTGKKLVCLGNMEELGAQSKRAHTLIGKKIGELQFDYLFTLGDKAEGIAHAALDAGIQPDHIFTFFSHVELLEKLQTILQPHDAVLVKGSQSMRMEKIVVGLLAEPHQAHTLLVRQYGSWKKS